MTEVIRLVCPECDAVHRVKSVTLGKLYRCKKCRSGLITMQPAVLRCPNCGATTPPMHIEASKLITCEECEKAPLMEVLLPGMELSNPLRSDENEVIASKMSLTLNTSQGEAELESLELPGAETEELGDDAVAVASEEDSPRDEEQNSEEQSSEFNTDTNFIMKNVAANAQQEVEPGVKVQQQLNIFERTEEFTEPIEAQGSELEYDSAIYDESEELMPGIELQEQTQQEFSQLAAAVPVVEPSFEGYEKVVESGSALHKTRWNWRLPAWIPAVLVLLLVGLYGLLYADLESLRVQLEKSQESIINQDKSFQEERQRYIALIHSTQEENRKLRSELIELTSENNVLRKKSISLEIPELQD